MRFVKIEKIKKTTPKDVYHLTIHKNRNFFANNLCVHNCDYRGEIKVILMNLTDTPVTIKHGDRIAQMVINRYEKISWEDVDELDITDRGEGGFGSTGK